MLGINNWNTGKSFTKQVLRTYREKSMQWSFDMSDCGCLNFYQNKFSVRIYLSVKWPPQTYHDE